jgi:hypothetical protein
MQKSRKPRRPGGQTGARWAVTGLGLLSLAGCSERDRLTFPNVGDGVGPVTTIDRPNGSDTTVTAGPDLVVTGRTIDLDGVDTVYFLVTGGNQNVSPFRSNPPADTVRFGIPLSTAGRAGDTILIQIYGVDTQGNAGDVSARQIVVQ